MREIPEISDAMLVFPAINERTEWLPSRKDIPSEYEGKDKWTTFFNDMFFSGAKELELIPKEGVDAGKAWRVLKALSGTYGIQHEHKEEAFAFLASEWFEDVKYKAAKP